MKNLNIKNQIFLILSLFLFTTGCDKISELLNPFTGTWKSGPFTLTLNTDKTFIFETGIGITIQSEGNYEYDKEMLVLDFNEESKMNFNYEFNDKKSELYLLPKTKSTLFKAKINFKKE